MTEKEPKKLPCPGCGAVLEAAYAEANYGRVLLVDQCPECGGVWFDRWELYFLKPESVRRLAGVDTEAFLAANPAASGPDDCPKCDQPLEPFIDPTLPEDALIKRCVRCSGLWLNRGGLTRYAEHRGAKGGGAGGPGGGGGGGGEGGEEAGLDARRLEALKKLQKELDTSGIAEGLGPLYAPGLAAAAEPLDGGEFARDAGFLILQALARLVFKI